MYSIVSQISALFAHPAVVSMLTVQSKINQIKSWTRPAITYSQTDYSGQKILVFALYQKGELRPDTMRLLRTAKDAGLYVIAVNTLKLKDPTSLNGLVDCYTEKHNFGRDFGSYRHAFLHLFDNGWHKECPRLMMVNDSVYFTEDRLPAFFDEMMNSDIEALGSTENHEVSYHLGSFCIAIGNHVLAHPTFEKYWKKFRPSDVRPRVIKYGEMGLSKTLLRCVSSYSQIRALYSARRFSELLESADDNLLDEIITLNRRSENAYSRFTFSDQLEAVMEEYAIEAYGLEEVGSDKMSFDDLSRSHIYVDSYQTLKRAIMERLRFDPNEELIGIRNVIVSNLLENFNNHSQIHHNCSLLLKMGLPIVKLDGVFRGMFNVADVKNIAKQLKPAERRELEELLLSRPFGGDVLIGWRRAAFMRGLI